MKKVLKPEPKPTQEETNKLDNKFYLPGWQFEVLIEKKCTHITNRIILWEKSDPVYATMYGLQGQFAHSKKSCVCNFFVQFRNSVYQFRSIESAVQIFDLLKKEHKYDEYLSKLADAKWKERVRIRKEKLAAKQLIAINKKAAA